MMAVKLKKKRRAPPKQTLRDHIKQRRTQMLLHSYLYYERDQPIIDDGTFDKWARELVELHKEMPVMGFYDSQFEDWDGSSGAHLSCPDWLKAKSTRYLPVRGVMPIARIPPLRKTVVKKKVIKRKRKPLRKKVRL